MKTATQLESAVNYFNSLSPIARNEIMQKVGYNKSITIWYRKCIAWIIENKPEAK